MTPKPDNTVTTILDAARYLAKQRGHPLFFERVAMLQRAAAREGCIHTAMAVLEIELADTQNIDTRSKV